MSAANTTPGASDAPIDPEADLGNAIPADDHDDVSEDLENRSVTSSTASIASSILGFREENGRTYHKYKDGKYMYPNDNREVERLDLQHNIYLHTFEGQLGTAPSNQPGAKVGRVLDVGTGSGIWAVDFGEEHPESEVLGFDLSPSMPNFVPPNVKFEIDDLEEPWIYSRPFDYIHSRMMNTSISNWNAYIKKCYDNLTPGGYLEVNEIDCCFLSDDGTLKPEHSLTKVGHLLQEATEIAGRPYHDVKSLAPILSEVGFEDVKIRQFKWPTNTWPKDAKFKERGSWNNDNLLMGWEAICMGALTRSLGWTREEVLLMIAQNRKDISNREIHAYQAIWSIYGRKPEKQPEEESA